MTQTKTEYSQLHQVAEELEDPAFGVLEFFLEESEETDQLVLTDEFLENNERPYITKSEIEEELEFTDEDIEEALNELTGRTEGEGYLETNDYLRRSGFHEDHDRYGRMTDGDIRRMTEYREQIDRESPDELSFRLGEKVRELEDTIEVLEESPEAGEVYLFISANEDRDSTEHSYPETEGVPLSEIKGVLGSDVAEHVKKLQSSYGDEVSALTRRRLSPKAIYKRVEGEPEQSKFDEVMSKIGLSSEYSEEDLEPYSDEAAVLYRTDTSDMINEDPVRDRLVAHLREKFSER